MELLYHYLWHHRMWGREMSTVQGQQIVVRTPGRHNDDAGPDFSNARIMIDGREWIGDVEIHIKASDWFNHGHDKDPAYNSVILHIVVVDDRRITRDNGEEIPQITVVMPENFYLTYADLTRELKAIRCQRMLKDIPPLLREDWLETLGMERLQMKAQRLLDYNTRLNGDREQAVFALVARGLGFGLNGLPFEMLALNLPLKYIYHHADNLMQVEAILFGQAGMLISSEHIFDEYYHALCNEYAFLARKYGLRPGNRSIWKYARTRPQNFPHRRIALLARMLHQGIHLSSTLTDARGDVEKLSELFSIQLGGYWTDHFAFGDMTEKHLPAALSSASKTLLMINVAAPFYTANASLNGDYLSAEASYDLLRKLPAEKNSKIKVWEEAGFEAADAFRSQALIQLNDEYCEKGRCLDCRFGHFILRCKSKPQVSGENLENINSMELCGDFLPAK